MLTHFASHPAQMFALLFIIAFAKSTILISTFLPPASVMLLSGLAISHTSLHPVVAWSGVMAGATVGSIVNFQLGRAMACRARFGRMRHADKLLLVQNRLQRNAIWVIFTSRFIALLRYLVPLAAGTLSVPAWQVYSASLASSALWAAILTGAAHGVGVLIPSLI